MTTDNTKRALSPVAEASKAIRAALKKEHGWTSRDVSVRSSNYSMGSSITVEIRNPKVDAEKVEAIAKDAERISRCSMTGDILSGGNRYVSVQHSSECQRAMAAPYVDAVRAALEELDTFESTSTLAPVRIDAHPGVVHVGHDLPNVGSWACLWFAEGDVGSRSFDRQHGVEHAAFVIAKRLGSRKPTPRLADDAAEKLASKLEGLAEKDRAKADELSGPMTQNWTARRARIKDGQRAEAARRVDVAEKLEALAKAHRAGECPDSLLGLKSRKAVEEVSGGYVEAALDRLVVKMGTGRTEEQIAAEARETELRESREKLRVRKVAGFFPTPEPTAARLMELAEVFEGAVVLEPSAGAGDLVRPALAAGARVSAIEIAPDLVELMRAEFGVADMKGERDGVLVTTFPADQNPRVVCSDFLDVSPSGHAPVDIVIMNPPFEKRQDEKHVRHAARFLRGRPWANENQEPAKLVAIVTKRAADALDEDPPGDTHLVHREDLPSGWCNGAEATRQTGVAACIIVLAVLP